MHNKITNEHWISINCEKLNDLSSIIINLIQLPTQVYFTVNAIINVLYMCTLEEYLALK